MEERNLLNERFKWDKKQKELIDTQTGEIYSTLDQIKEWLSKVDIEKQLDNALIKDIKDTYGVKTALQLYQLQWKDDSWFIKIYRTEMREYKKHTKLSSSAGLVLFYLQEYIEYKTNRITNKNGAAFTNKELIKLVNISENTLLKALNELEEKKFIKRIGSKRAREIYFNPYLATSGNEVDKDTIKMFDDYTPITPY